MSRSLLPHSDHQASASGGPASASGGQASASGGQASASGGPASASGAPGLARRGRPGRWVPLALLLGLLGPLGIGGCDEKFEKFLKSASDRQQAREEKKAETAALQARGLGPADAVSPEIARAINVVRTSDYEFIIRKTDKNKRARKRKADDDEGVKRVNGFDFAATLNSKSRWLGRGITDLPTWLDEIGSATFFTGDAYIVRLPDGREMSFRTWLLEELAALPPEPPKEEPAP